MAFPTPNYSRTKINAAGRILISDEASTAERNEAFTLLNHWRSCHAYPINTFQSTLRSRLKNIYPEALVAQRLKRTPSILKKLLTNPGELGRMQDIGGLRAIVNNLSQVRKLEKLYTNGSLSHESIKIDDYITTPKESGYRSLHLIYKYKNPSNNIYDGLFLELQIRTKLQHAWATAVETIGTFLNQALKSSDGEADWLNYFKTISAAFAHLEKSPVPLAFNNRSAHSIYSEAVALTEKLDVREKLRAFALVANAIETRQSQGNYHLVVLNATLRTVDVTSFGKPRLEEANIAYAKIERESHIDTNIQAVLVATNSIDALRKAYPNYFLDTREFTRAISRIEQNIISTN